MPKLASTLALFQTLPEQLAVVQKALAAVAVTPALFGRGAPMPKPGS